jgi:hypothetical protein
LIRVQIGFPNQVSKLSSNFFCISSIKGFILLFHIDFIEILNKSSSFIKVSIFVPNFPLISSILSFVSNKFINSLYDNKSLLKNESKFIFLEYASSLKYTLIFINEKGLLFLLLSRSFFIAFNKLTKLLFVEFSHFFNQSHA